MRQLQEMADQARLDKELATMEATGFSKAEVAEFRRFFIAFDEDQNGYMSLEEAMAMMKDICPFGAKNAAEFTKIFDEVVQDGAGKNPGHATFPDFLFLMRRLLDVNFAQILDRTKSAQQPLSPR